MTSGRHIAVIGSGFSGSLLAIHLLRRAGLWDRIYLIERNAQFGRGLAYSTGNPSHLLNVRASNMSAFADAPEHFLEWLCALPGEQRDGITGEDDRLTFAPRRLYGTYIQSILHQGIWGEDNGRKLYLVADEAVKLHPSAAGVAVEVGGGRIYEADAAVLATGNSPPAASRPGYFGNPWDPAIAEHFDPRAPILLVGTGLTMIDVVVSLLDGGHEGPITAISRRGLLPAVHAATSPHPRFLPAASAPRTVAVLLRLIRAEIDRARLAGQDWRAVIDALRPDTQDLWRRLPLAEKQRFLRHLRPWWDVHRHRMAPQVAARIDRARRSGQLVIRRGRLQGFDAQPARVVAHVAFTGAERPAELEVGRIINCSGPQSNYAEIADPLVRDLLGSGLARPDLLGLGLAVTADGAIIGRDETASDRLFALGPVTKGAFWETTAVPDIRRQAEILADRLMAQLPVKRRLELVPRGEAAAGQSCR
jgi:uncharacterized NAD(P)/FAD-binding protein YdhS